MKQIILNEVSFTNYRNFDSRAFSFQPGVNLLVGPNGIGKTNILESISFLSPGKGLKSAHFDDVCLTGTKEWRSVFVLDSKLGKAEISNIFQNSGHKKRNLCFNGSKISASELPNFLNVLWVTPQMEDFFLASASNRRKFLDRIVYNFTPDHAKEINLYDHLLKERNKILADSYRYGSSGSQSATTWLESTEHKIAKSAYNIHTARHQALALMQHSVDELADYLGRINLRLNMEYEPDQEHFMHVYMHNLVKYREKDYYSGRSNFGIHKTDLEVWHAGKAVQAKFCSTGEQKAMLVMIILSSIATIMHNTSATPIVLLDEIFVHLDEIRKNQVVEYINSVTMQIFITATDILGIEKLASASNVISL